MFSCIISLHDCEKLQYTLKAIEHWSAEWQLPLTLNKCNVLSFYGRNCPINYHYFILNFSLSSIDSISDLGVILESDLSFSKQIDNICSKARCRSAMILKSFQRDMIVIIPSVHSVC